MFPWLVHYFLRFHLSKSVIRSSNTHFHLLFFILIHLSIKVKTIKLFDAKSNLKCEVIVILKKNDFINHLNETHEMWQNSARSGRGMIKKWVTCIIISSSGSGTINLTHAFLSCAPLNLMHMDLYSHEGPLFFFFHLPKLFLRDSNFV